MAKVMLFIDGTWLYRNVPNLRVYYGDKEFGIDYGLLPKVLAGEVGKQLGKTEVDVVRTYLFGSFPTNVDPTDDDLVENQLDFYKRLAEEHHYEVEKFKINFKGKRLRRSDRDPRDPFQPKEKCVDIALATSMLFFAAIPYTYDVAIAVIGDQDFVPVLQHVRRLGKRVAIASIKAPNEKGQLPCYRGYHDPANTDKAKDFDIIWLDDLLNQIELKFEKQQLECQAPTHNGARKVWTTYHPRKDEKFYCPQCKEQFDLKRRETEKELFGSAEVRMASVELGVVNEVEKKLAGKLYAINIEKPTKSGKTITCGFIRAADNREFYFPPQQWKGAQDFAETLEGLEVEFEVQTPPWVDEEGKPKAGKARNIRPVTSQ